ncbi:hypothetical protein D3C76_960930 [compost metagenome]
MIAGDVVTVLRYVESINGPIVGLRKLPSSMTLHWRSACNFFIPLAKACAAWVCPVPNPSDKRSTLFVLIGSPVSFDIQYDLYNPDG